MAECASRELKEETGLNLLNRSPGTDQRPINGIGNYGISKKQALLHTHKFSVRQDCKRDGLKSTMHTIGKVSARL